MFNLGAGEVMLILVVALLILGPKRLPELARGMGKFFREFRRQTDEVRTVVEREFYRMDQDINAEDRAPAGTIAAGSPVAPVPALQDPADTALHDPRLHDPAFRDPALPEPAATGPAAPSPALPDPAPPKPPDPGPKGPEGA